MDFLSMMVSAAMAARVPATARMSSARVAALGLFWRVSAAVKVLRTPLMAEEAASRSERPV